MLDLDRFKACQRRARLRLRRPPAEGRGRNACRPRPSAPATWWRVSPVMNLHCCCRAARRHRPWPWPSASPAPSSSPSCWTTTPFDLAAGFGVACWPEHASDAGHAADTLMSRAEIAMYTAKQKTASAMVYHPSIDAGSAQTLSLLSELRQAVGTRRAAPVPAAEDRSRHGPPAGRRGPGALAAPAAWPGAADAVHPVLPNRPASCVSSRCGSSRETARQWPVLRALGPAAREREPVDPRPARPGPAGRKAGKPAAALRRAGPGLLPGDHRKRHHGRAPACAGDAETRSARPAFKLSIDDFGTGYSSLAYLKKLLVDELKIDKSFRHGPWPGDAEDEKIVRSTIDLAHKPGLDGGGRGRGRRRPSWTSCARWTADEAQGLLHEQSRCRPPRCPGFAARWAAKQAVAGGSRLNLTGAPWASLTSGHQHQPQHRSALADRQRRGAACRRRQEGMCCCLQRHLQQVGPRPAACVAAGPGPRRPS